MKSGQGLFDYCVLNMIVLHLMLHTCNLRILSECLFLQSYSVIFTVISTILRSLLLHSIYDTGKNCSWLTLKNYRTSGNFWRVVIFNTNPEACQRFFASCPGLEQCNTRVGTAQGKLRPDRENTGNFVKSLKHREIFLTVFNDAKNHVSFHIF